MKDHKINENAFKKCTRLHNAEKFGVIPNIWPSNILMLYFGQAFTPNFSMGLTCWVNTCQQFSEMLCCFDTELIG